MFNVRIVQMQIGRRREGAVPDAIACDIRNSFAAWVGRSVRAEGGTVAAARDVVRRLLGHGDGGDVLARYWDDDERHVELQRYTPLRLVMGGGAERSAV
jgi:hypothetical protein